MRRVPTAQLVFIVVALIYLLESLFLRGLFSNMLIYFSVLLVGVIVMILSAIRKEFYWMIFDLIVCLVCSGIVYYFYFILSY